MTSVTIGFSKPKRWALHAWIIEWVDRAPFDHAYLKLYSSTFNRNIIYQATAKGVEFISTAVWAKECVVVEEYQIEIDEVEAIKLAQYCIDNAGISYGLMASIGAGLVEICSRLGIVIDNPFYDGPDSAFCSEIVARCLGVVGYQFDSKQITPRELRDALLIRKGVSSS